MWNNSCSIETFLMSSDETENNEIIFRTCRQIAWNNSFPVICDVTLLGGHLIWFMKSCRTNLWCLTVFLFKHFVVNVLKTSQICPALLIQLSNDRTKANTASQPISTHREIINCWNNKISYKQIWSLISCLCLCYCTELDYRFDKQMIQSSKSVLLQCFSASDPLRKV